MGSTGSLSGSGSLPVCSNTSLACLHGSTLGSDSRDVGESNHKQPPELLRGFLSAQVSEKTGFAWPTTGLLEVEQSSHGPAWNISLQRQGPFPQSLPPHAFLEIHLGSQVVAQLAEHTY